MLHIGLTLLTAYLVDLLTAGDPFPSADPFPLVPDFDGVGVAGATSSGTSKLLAVLTGALLFWLELAAAFSNSLRRYSILAISFSTQAGVSGIA